MTDTADRVAMSLAEALHGTSVGCNSIESGRVMLEKLQEDTRKTAAILSSHGLRELIEAADAMTYMEQGWTMEDLMDKSARLCAALTALLPDSPTVKGEK